jgi:ribosomal protein S5
MDEIVQIFISALPLLLRGAAVVLTLKNFDGTAAAFRSAVDRAKATMVALPSLDPSSVKVLHLMSNGADEVTLVARLKSDAD